MPKDPSSRCSMSAKSRGLYKPYSSSAHATSGASQDSSSRENEELALQKEWEDATCPICMEHPHNAVLLVCSSHDNGCRPYMCDTSYRHSNCLDQYRKANSMPDRTSGGSPSVSDLSVESASGPAWHGEVTLPQFSTGDRGDPRRSQERSSRRGSSLGDTRQGAGPEDRASDRVRVPLVLAPQRMLVVDEGDVYGERREALDATRESRGASDVPQRGAIASAGDKELKCPLCRGKVEGWKVMESARHHLNHKKRSCSQETCSFSGTYDELRKHARGVHPLARPSDVDPARQRDWRRLERQRDLADVLSTLRSAMPGATVYGDFVIDEEEEGEHGEDGQEIEFPGDGENWWTMILLFQVFGPAASMGGGRGIGRLRGGYTRGRLHHHQSGNSFPRQTLWGEDLQASGGGGAANTLPTGAGSAGDTILSSTSRRRRSRPRSRGDAQ